MYHTVSKIRCGAYKIENNSFLVVKMRIQHEGRSLKNYLGLEAIYVVFRQVICDHVDIACFVDTRFEQYRYNKHSYFSVKSVFKYTMHTT
jgi:hypothetical protein